MIGHVLALDLATTTGWAVLDEGGVIRSGSRNLGYRVLHGDSDHRHGQIFTRASSWFGDLCFEWRPNVVVYETSGSRFKGQAGMVGLGLRACLLVACYSREILVDPVNQSTWKAWAKKNGGWSPEDKGDEADACNVGRWWLANRYDCVESL